jgi:FAD/FMN-containing dehydrogenase
MNYVVPLLGIGLLYCSRAFWFYIYETFGVTAFSVSLTIFLGCLYLIYQWIVRITQPARCFVVVDANGKITCTNWGLNQTFTPAELAIPKTLEELQTVIKNRKQKHVKPFGSLHSWSACANTDGLAIDMKQLNRVLQVNPEKMTIKAEAGIMLKDFFEALKPYKMAIATMPNVNMISLGGAVSNGTHGTNIKHGTFADAVEEIELINYKGELMTLRRDSEDEKEKRYFDAAVISFGSLGIIYSITMKCIPEYNMIIYRETSSLEDYIKNVVEISHSYMSSMTVILPSIGQVMIKTQTRIKPLGTDEVTMKTGHSLTRMEVLAAILVHVGLDFLPSSIVRLIKMYPMMKWKWNGITVVPWDQAEQLPHTKRFINMEYAIPEENVSEAIKFVSDLVSKFAKDGRYFRQMAWCVRPVGPDSRGYLSSTKRENGKPTYYIDVPYQNNLGKDEIEFYKELEKGMLDLGGRVSFARLFWNHSPSVLRNFPDREKFIAVKKELDPENVFSNKLTNAVLFGDVNSEEFPQ